MGKLTVDDFILRAKKCHGDKYDYSQVIYKNANTKVTIICPEHGTFEQTPSHHYNGQGCPKCVDKKRKATWLERYGVDNPMKNKAVLNKAEATLMKRCGVAHPLQSDVIKERTRKNNVAKFGVDNPMKVSSIRQKAEDTVMERYGVTNAMQSDIVKERARKTSLEHYGVEHPMQSEEVRSLAKATCMERYGVDNPMKNESVVDKVKATNVERYGVENVFASEAIKNKIRMTNLERYGVEYPAQNDAILEAMFNARTYSVSEQENAVYEMLVERFGEEDVLRQYKSEAYPFHCDFYIKSRDLYIEFNGLWTHGGHWFSGSDADQIKYGQWLEKAEDSTYYRNAIDTWVRRDKLKRRTAAENKLNYVVFWSFDEAILWAAWGCPDGQDYIGEMTWKVEKNIDL